LSQLKETNTSNNYLNINIQMDLFFRASVEMDKLRRTTTQDMARLEAAMRKSDLQVARRYLFLLTVTIKKGNVYW
jgi:hypothetical protein